MDSRAIGKLFLAPAVLLTGLSQVRTKALPDVHARNRYGVSIIGLQTMSDMTS